MKKKNTDEEIELEETSLAEEEVVSDNEALAGDKIKKLREELKKAQAERSEYLAGWQRSKADFVNLRQREEAWKEEFVQFSNRELIEEFLPVLEGFEIAFSNKEAWEKVDKAWRSGIEHIHAMLLSVLGKHGLKRLGNIGEKFDPYFHNAVEREGTLDSDKDGTIAKVLQEGFTLKDKVIRPAKVVVFYKK